MLQMQCLIDGILTCSWSRSTWPPAFPEAGITTYRDATPTRAAPDVVVSLQAFPKDISELTEFPCSAVAIQRHSVPPPAFQHPWNRVQNTTIKAFSTLSK